jgi:hypothetical protein
MGIRLNPADYIGKKYNRWTVLKYEGTNHLKKSQFLCRCDCGKEKVVTLGNLKTGQSKSCGCLNDENRKGNTWSKKHGMSFSREYRSWESMLARCECITNKEYPDWGGRGIKVCERWHDFNNFYADMGARPKGTTLDRIDNNGDYEASNCRWATAKTQSNNRRSNTLITYKGRTQTLQQWADETGICSGTISQRIRKRGWSIEKALTTPSLIKRKREVG